MRLGSVGPHVQDDRPKPMVGDVSPPYQSQGKEGISKGGDKGEVLSLGIASAVSQRYDCSCAKRSCTNTRLQCAVMEGD